MKPNKIIEASIRLPDGTEISVKGSKGNVAEIISAVAKDRNSHGDQAAPGGLQARAHRGGGGLDHVVEKDSDGKVHIVATDLKAKTAIDAAHRVIYLTLLARRQLLNENKTPRKIIVEALRSWNLYDGNSRRLIARDKALIRDGRKTVSLSNPAVEEARKYATDIQDPGVKGEWTPSGGRRHRARGKKKKLRSVKPE